MLYWENSLVREDLYKEKVVIWRKTGYFGDHGVYLGLLFRSQAYKPYSDAPGWWNWAELWQKVPLFHLGKIIFNWIIEAFQPLSLILEKNSVQL